MEKKLLIIIVSPLVIGISLLLIISVIDLDLRFTPLEMSIFHYRYDVQSFSNLKENLYNTISVDKSVAKNVDNPALENPFTNKISIDENVETLEPEPMLDADIIKRVEPIEFKVSLIMIGNGKKIAIVNGKILKQGDTIKGFKVDKIEGQKVLLISDNRSYWIRVDGNKD